MPKLLAIFAIAAGCAMMTNDSSTADATAARARKPSAWQWGLTLDDVSRTQEVTDALAALPARATARVVFDTGRTARSYAEPVAAIHRVADVMGELVDSQFVDRYSVDEYRARARSYLEVLGSDVDVWEVGNEINGEWLGEPAAVMAKVNAAYDETRAAKRRTALTLYYDEGCSPSAKHEMFRWIDVNVPAALRGGVDEVLVSYYEDDCDGRQPDWRAVFARLARVFPSAALGFGECGTKKPAAKRQGGDAPSVLRHPASGAALHRRILLVVRRDRLRPAEPSDVAGAERRHEAVAGRRPAYAMHFSPRSWKARRRPRSSPM